MLISGLSWYPVLTLYLTLTSLSLSPCNVPVTSPCASLTFLTLLGPPCKNPVTASSRLPDPGAAPHLIFYSILPSRVPVPLAEINILGNQSHNQAPAYKIYSIYISGPARPMLWSLLVSNCHLPHYIPTHIHCTSVSLLHQFFDMSDLYSNRGRIHNEQKIKQPQLYTTSAAYRSDPVPSRLRFILVTSNQSLLYTIAFTYGRLVYFSAIAALYVLPYIGVRLHTDIGTNQPFSYKTALNYRPDR